MRKPARVTTNDGSFRRVISVPCAAPISAHASSAATTAAHHGHLVVAGCTSWTPMTPPTAAT